MTRIAAASSKFDWGKRASAVFILFGTTAITLPAQTFATLHSFDVTDGDYPKAALVQGADVNLYGTTSDRDGNVGTVFNITLNGALTTLHTFCTHRGCGFEPVAALVQAANGDFYGTTQSGGGPNGGGTIFKITPSGTLTTLYNFCAHTGCPDGFDVVAGLVQATNGDFYGTTQYGGANGYGTVFKITPSGTLTQLLPSKRMHGRRLPYCRADPGP